MSIRPLVQIEDLDVIFGSGRSAAHVLKRVSLEIPEGVSLGLVGESGSGKSTLAKALVGLVPVSGGKFRIDDHMVKANVERKPLPPSLIQMIPQDPYSSLDPRRTAGEALAEALDPRRADVKRHHAKILDWLERVELAPDSVTKYPHEFSGGQRQRIAIARALCVEPRFVVADEVTSALDLSVQAEVLKLLARLKKELSLTMIFISHNLAVVRRVSDEVAVMLHGEVVERGEVDAVFRTPEHAYTRSLLASAPGGSDFKIHKSHKRRTED